MPVFDADLVEEVNPAKAAAKNAKPQWRNQLIQGDCLSACAHMRRNNIAADLVYIDPPFASGANYAKNILLRRTDNEKSALQSDDSSLGEEVLYNDIWQKEDYLNWIYERLLAIREIMSENASIYVHLDWHIGHYVKILMDEVFGEENLQNEIVWCYTGPTSPGLRRFNRKHDVIFWYTKSDSWVFNESAMRVPHKDPQQKLRKAFDAGKGIGESEVQKLRERGKLLEDYWHDTWDDIALAVRSPKERVGYPTQKPQKLVERIIQASSNEGDLVVDFFSGSGTTARAAHALGRRFIGCDVGINGIQTSRDGLRKAGASFDILKIRDGVRLFRNPAQTEERVFSLIPKWESREKLGLGEFWDGGIAGENGAFTPVKFVGIQELLTKQVFDVVLDAAAELGGAGQNSEQATVLYAHKEEGVDQSYADREARKYRRGDVRIRLLSLDELLAERGGEFYAPDCADVSREQIAGGWRVRLESFFSPYLKAKLDAHNERLLHGKKAAALLKVEERGLELVESVQFDVRGSAEVSKNRAQWVSDSEDSPKKGMVRGEYEVKAEGFRMKIRSVAGDELIVSSEEMTVLSSDRKIPKAKAPKAKAPKAKAPKAKAPKAKAPKAKASKAKKRGNRP